MSKETKYILKGVFGITGAFYIITVVVGVVLMIGTKSEPSEVTPLDAVQVLLAFMGWHWAIEWVIGMFKRDES